MEGRLPLFRVGLTRRADLAVVAGILTLSFFVLLGEAGQLDPPPVIRILNVVAAGGLILFYILHAPRLADRVDKGVLLAVLLMAGASLLSRFPRQSLDGLLGALLFAAALFAARSLLWRESGRRALVICLMGLSAFFTLFTAAGWLPVQLEWWSLTDWSVVPPLTLNFAALPWGHRHDLTLLVVMLYPSWYLLPMNPIRAALATVTGTLAALIVLVDGSRTLWLALVLASAILGAWFIRRFWPRDRQRQTAIGAAAILVLAVLVASGVVGLLIERGFSAASLDLRVAMWRSVIEAWSSEPIAGYGPGSFPWVLQLTDYFQTNSLAPRHPDSAPFQLLAEGGILGIAAAAVLLITLVPALYRGRSRAALWVLLVFLLASFGQNPTDFGFLVAVAISWAAFGAPRPPVSTEATSAGDIPSRRSGSAIVRGASLVAFALIGLAWMATAFADISYSSARAAIDGGDIDEAVPPLAVAHGLDPGMALYSRQLGIAYLLTGDAPRAIEGLVASTERNPSDDLAWRSLGIAYAQAGSPASTLTALKRAIDTQRSDPTNLLLEARWELAGGETQAVVAVLAEIVQAWPEIIAAPGWEALLPAGIPTGQIVDAALQRWTSGEPSPEPLSRQPVTLAIMAGRADLADQLARELLGPSMGPTYVAAMSCQPAASELLAQSTDADRRTFLYWSLLVRQSALEGAIDSRALRLAEIMSGTSFPPAEPNETLNPFDENGGSYSADIWGYRRIHASWPEQIALPSPDAGYARWYVEPRTAVSAADLDVTMPACR